MLAVAAVSNGCTNHAGKVIAGWPAALRAYLDRQVETGKVSAKEREAVRK